MVSHSTRIEKQRQAREATARRGAQRQATIAQRLDANALWCSSQARDIAPPHPRTPAPNARGSIIMPSQVCTAKHARTGKRCGRRTCCGEYCALHTSLILGLRVARSKVKGAGRGLFAERSFAEGELIIEYTGDVFYFKRSSGHLNSRYALMFRRNGRYILIDSARTNSGIGRYANDARGTRFRNNAEFCTITNKRGVGIYALKKIGAGSEIFISYGPAYWTNIPKKKK
jgi:hypothetical protein